MLSFFKTKPNNPEQPAGFAYPIGTIRVTQSPDGRWRCQSYGLCVPGFAGAKPYYLPAWATVVWPPGNEAGFESEEEAVAAWKLHEERKKQPDRILFTPANASSGADA